MGKYIIAHLRGEHGMLKSCVVNGIILNIITSYFILLCMSIIKTKLFIGRSLLYFILWILYLSVGLWVYLGIFHSTKRHFNQFYATQKIFAETAITIWAVAWATAIILEGMFFMPLLVTQ